MKSPPELWAEVSDAASLARHLGEVGEITITRLEPETTVAWEGERASGTIELAPAGWGTSVTLTAAPVTAEPEPAAVTEPEPDTAAEPEPEPEPQPVAATEPAPEPTAMAEPEPQPRRSWFTRLFGRRRATADAHRAGGDEDARAPGEDPGRAHPESTGPARSSAGPEPEPQQTPKAEPQQPPDPLEAALNQALDSLGQAHHRPFSRG